MKLFLVVLLLTQKIEVEIGVQHRSDFSIKLNDTIDSDLSPESAWANSQNGNYFHSKWSKLSFWVKSQHRDRTEFSLCTFPQREKPVFITGFPGDKNMFFPVRKSTLGKPWWVCSVVTVALFFFQLEINHVIQQSTLPRNGILSQLPILPISQEIGQNGLNWKFEKNYHSN